MEAFACQAVAADHVKRLNAVKRNLYLAGKQSDAPFPDAEDALPRKKGAILHAGRSHVNL